MAESPLRTDLVSDEQLAGAIDAFDAAITRSGIPPGDLIDADYIALRAMRELQDRRVEVAKYKAWAASCVCANCNGTGWFDEEAKEACDECADGELRYFEAHGHYPGCGVYEGTQRGPCSCRTVDQPDDEEALRRG